jgi:hypothetical protein
VVFFGTPLTHVCARFVHAQVVHVVLREAENVQQRLRSSSVESMSADSVHCSSKDFMEALVRSSASPAAWVSSSLGSCLAHA